MARLRPRTIELTDRQKALFYMKVGLPDENGHQLWLASKDKKGYGQFAVFRDGKSSTFRAHQVMWQLSYGPPPEDAEELDHTCDVRDCVALSHLKWVTHAENTTRAFSRREYCRSGRHRWDEQEPMPQQNGAYRRCRPCKYEKGLESYRRNRKVVNPRT